jgi:hypothetical protein
MEDREVDISPASSGSLTIEVKKRKLTMHQVTSSEVDGLFSAGNTTSMHLGFFGISVGTLITCSVTLATVDLSATPNRYATFVGLTWISLISTVFFSSSYRAYMAAKRKQR